MRKHNLMKRCLSTALSLAMVVTMIPAPAANVVKAEGESSILDTALANYDFADFTAKDGEDNVLTNGTKDIILEAFGGCKVPELVQDEERGQVLSLTQQGEADNGVDVRGDALLPENPFESQSTDNGFTLNFWTKTTGNAAGNRCLVDFELAPATTGRAGTLAVTQTMVFWNTTDQEADRFMDINTSGLGLDAKTWKMVTMAVTNDNIIFYSNGKKIESSVDATNCAKIMSDLAGGLLEDGQKTNVRLGASLAKYWIGAGALLDDVSFFGKALTADEVTALYKATGPELKAVAVTGGNTVGVNGTLQLDVSLTPDSVTVDTDTTWKSSDEAILTVSEAGVVTGVAEGKASVTATVAGIESEPFEITVVNAAEGTFNELMENFTLEKTVVTEDFELPATIGDNTTVTWASDNAAITLDGTTAKVTRSDENVTVNLTADVAYNDGSSQLTATKRFPVTVRLNTVVLDTALVTYDFADFSSRSGGVLTDGKNAVTLETAGSGAAPELVKDAARGQVLSLTEQSYANRGAAVLANPFEGKNADDGFTLSFWTKTTGSVGGGKTLVDFEVAPATSGRAGTFAVNQSMVYWNTTDQNSNFVDFNIGNMNLDKKNGWKMVTMTITKNGVAFYRDGVKISHSITGNGGVGEDYAQIISDLTGGLLEDGQKTNVRLGASLATYWSCAGALMDEVSFFGKALSADEIAALYQETMIPVALESVEVTGEKNVDEEDSVQLSVTLLPADTTVNKTVTWKSDNEDVLTVDKNGKAKGLKAGTANVTATVAGIESKPFEITVKDMGLVGELSEGYYLTVYSTQNSFYERQNTAGGANLEQETRSVYMAVSKDGKTFEVLNNGGGVIFSKNTSGSLQVTKPRVFQEDGKFTVVAQDATASKGFHVFTSEDGVNYYDDEIVKETELTASPLRKANFPLLLNGKNILDSDDTITLGNALEITEDQYNYIVNKLGSVVNNGLESLEELKIKNTDNVTEEILSEMYPSVNATYSDGSTQNFKIDWTGALDEVDLTKDGTYELTGEVGQPQYLNNLQDLNGSDLAEDDPENVNPDYPDNYNPETGEVYYDATKFVEGMADPYIYWDEQTGYYYMTGSYFPEDGDEIDEDDKINQYDRVVLRRGKTLEDLQTRADQVTIWKVGNQGYDDNGKQVGKGYRYIWAPEIHRVGNYWVVYFTESHSGSNAYDIYSHALILDGDKDPYDTALESASQASEWKDYKMCTSDSAKAEAKDGIPADPFSTSFCLDMTYFKDEVSGTSYVIWAGKPTAAYKGGNTDLFIATVDTEKPWMITSAATRITKSDYGWERITYCVNEGATVLQKDGNIFMAYSASGTGSEYAIGMLSAKGGADLLNAENWTKSPYPLLTSRDVNGEEGPGHNSFTVDKDGNVIFVYHARPTSHNYKACGNYSSQPLNDPCRHARLKRVHWAADGTPVLKMTYEDELLDEYKTVTLSVNVGEGGSTLAIPVTEVTLDKTELTMEIGDKDTLTATIAPENATSPQLTWDSSSPDIVFVDQNGVITAKKPGTVTISAIAVSGVTAECEVTVNEPEVAVTGVTLDKAALSLKVGGTDTLTATIAPENATDQTLTWTSSNADVASVDNGKVTAKKAGTATITATAANGVKAECTVTVTEAEVAVTGITLSKNSLTLAPKKSATLTATVAPENATNKTVTWKSSNTKVATVENGKVTAKAAGTANITATTVNGKTATCKVTVKVPVTKVKMSKTKVTLGVKEKLTLKATITPSNATNKKVTWKSSNTKVATVKNGVVTAKKTGKTNITATVDGKKVTCKVTVKKAPTKKTKVTLNKKKATLKVKKTFQIKAKVPAKFGSNKFIYTSSNKKVAKVSSTGKVTALKKGKATITVKTYNKKAKATIKITVK